MTSHFDSPLYGPAYADPDMARLFSASAEVRAMLLVEGALARAQGARGVIPEISAQAIHRASLEMSLDPAALAPSVAQNGIPVPGLVAAFRAAMNAPEHAQYAHWGATSQDIIDTGAALRLRRALDRISDGLDSAIGALADLAETHAETPMAARTWGQIATPSTFGAMVAVWGEGLLANRAALPTIRAGVEIVTLHGAAGTLSVMGPAGPDIRAHMAETLDLRDPDRVPHADRAHIRALGAWLDGVLQAAAKPATDLLLLTREGEVTLGTGGGSSTMPQKSNPVAPSIIRALAAHGAGLATTLGAAHWDQRDGGAWFTEWLALPPLVVATGRVLTLLSEMQVTPDAARLRAQLGAPDGLIHAEALSFALAADRPRPEAQAQVKAWAQEVAAEGGSLLARAGADPADYTPERQWGEAPDHARRFAAKARAALA